MAVDAIAALSAKGKAGSIEAAQPIGREAGPAAYAGTSDAAAGSVPFKGDVHEALQAQVDELQKAEQRLRVQGGLGEQASGVANQPAAPATSIGDAMNQVRTMFEFGVKATLLGSAATQSVSAVNTLAKSQ